MKTRRGFSLVELMIVLAIMATLCAMAVPRYQRAIKTSRVTVAIDEIEALEAAIEFYEQANGFLPASLDDLGDGPYVDPWGNPYQYLSFVPQAGGGKGNGKGKGKAKPAGKCRKDKFLHPINTSFDLYSMGPDGKSLPALTAKASRDDIVRANDGDYIGIAEGY